MFYVFKIFVNPIQAGIKKLAQAGGGGFRPPRNSVVYKPMMLKFRMQVKSNPTSKLTDFRVSSIRRWRHNDVIRKTMGNFGPRRNQTNDTSFERSRQGLFKNVLFIEIEAILKELWSFMWKKCQNLVESPSTNWLPWLHCWCQKVQNSWKRCLIDLY